MLERSCAGVGRAVRRKVRGGMRPPPGADPDDESSSATCCGATGTCSRGGQMRRRVLLRNLQRAVQARAVLRTD
jgi:hypothetical protein